MAFGPAQGAQGASGLAAITLTTAAQPNVTSLGTLTALACSSGAVLAWNADSGISRASAAVLALGNGTALDDSGTLQVANISRKAAASGTALALSGGAGTAGPGGLASLTGGAGVGTDRGSGGALLSTGLGSGAGTSDALVQTAYMLASGTSVQTIGDRVRVVGKTKTLSTTTATLTQFADIVVGTTLTGGRGFVTYCVRAVSTEIDIAAGHFDFTVVNKAGTLTVTAGTITDVKSSTSGSITSGVTVTASTTHCQLNVTPAFTTIVPTGVVLDWSIIWDGSPVSITVS